MHGVPLTTLKDRLVVMIKHGGKPGPKPYLNSEEKKELFSYLKASSMGYAKQGMTFAVLWNNVLNKRRMFP